MSEDKQSIIRQIRELLDRLEAVESGGKSSIRPLTEWLNLHGYPNLKSQRRYLHFADEQLQAGYTYEQIVKMFRWHRKTSILPLLKRFCDERIATTQSETAGEHQ